MKDNIIRAICALVALIAPLLLVSSWLGAAGARLNAEKSSPKEEVAIASVAEDDYCTPKLKSIVRRVATACGLIGGSGRGCQPMQAQQVAQLSDDEFNALFRPLSKKAHIVQFDRDEMMLDQGARDSIEQAWGDQGGASFFFVVSRASPDGNAKHNEELSAGRARSVLEHLEQKFEDPDLKKQVGLLWLGEGFAQLDETFCTWNRSRADTCTETEINRSAFMAWIDCAI